MKVNFSAEYKILKAFVDNNLNISLLNKLIIFFLLVKSTLHCKIKKWFCYNLESKCGQFRTVIRLHDLDLHCPQKLLVSSTVRKELTLSQTTNFRIIQIELADHNFKFDENGRKSIQMLRKYCGK